MPWLDPADVEIRARDGRWRRGLSVSDGAAWGCTSQPSRAPGTSGCGPPELPRKSRSATPAPAVGVLRSDRTQWTTWPWLARLPCRPRPYRVARPRDDERPGRAGGQESPAERRAPMGSRQAARSAESCRLRRHHGWRLAETAPSFRRRRSHDLHVGDAVYAREEEVSVAATRRWPYRINRTGETLVVDPGSPPPMTRASAA
jgi:hypothetical protein